jgi:UDP:flavonoid glycosyltransferase YjiC (YdhE family)
MRITFVAVGTRGDVQPYVALAIGLRNAGHKVRIATHHNFQTLVESHGLAYAPLAGDSQAIMGSEAGHRVMDANVNPFFNMGRLYELAVPLVHDLLRDAMNALADTDLAIGSPLGYNLAFGPALKLGVPLYGAFVQPIMPTGDFPLPLFPSLPRQMPLRRVYNRASYPLFMRLMWLFAARMGIPAYKEITGLPTPHYGQFLNKKSFYGETLFGYSRHVVPKPADWPATYHVCGFWFLDQASQWQPPAELEQFLAAGPPPVYIGFGSMSNRQPAEIAALTIKALQMAGQRGVLLTGWHGLDQASLPDSIFKIDSVPHDWLFPRMAALVHHGGSGTTGAAFRAGVPQIVVPFSFEQPFWGERTEALGVGVKPIPRKTLTAEKLAAAIERVVHDQPMHQKAQQLAALIKSEDGVGQAVAVVEQWLAKIPTNNQAVTAKLSR